MEKFTELLERLIQAQKNECAASKQGEWDIVHQYRGEQEELKKQLISHHKKHVDLITRAGLSWQLRASKK